MFSKDSLTRGPALQRTTDYQQLGVPMRTGASRELGPLA